MSLSCSATVLLHDECARALQRAERANVAAREGGELSPRSVLKSTVRAFTLDELEQENMMQEESLQKLRKG